jgi:hypothetical protein
LTGTLAWQQGSILDIANILNPAEHDMIVTITAVESPKITSNHITWVTTMLIHTLKVIIGISHHRDLESS